MGSVALWQQIKVTSSEFFVTAPFQIVCKNT